MTRFVDVETPYMANNEEQQRMHLLYARACVRDSLMRGETPFASHLFFTQPGILDDNLSNERQMGIEAGKKLIEAIPGIVTVVYQDLGISKGMLYGIERAVTNRRGVEYRNLENGWKQRELEIARKHSHATLWGFNHFQHLNPI